MLNNILVVEDDRNMLASLRHGIEESDQKNRVLAAGDGLSALKLLATHPVNLVVTDYRLPRMNGLSLIGETRKRFPDIPVFMITAHNSPETEYLARSIGASEYIEKPFKIYNLIDKIDSVIKNQSNGGILHNIFALTYLQMVAMEEQECTIRLLEKKTHKFGVLFFRNGKLLDARFNHFRGEKAADEILSWEEVSLQIQNSCSVEKARIKRGMQAIMMDAMVFKDMKKERTAREKKHSPYPARKPGAPSEKTPPPSSRKKASIASALGNQPGLVDIYKDASLKQKLQVFNKLGTSLDAGRLKIAHMVKNDMEQFILLPGRDYLVIAVNSKCNRDLLMENLALLS
jgi:DNA-binding response OmpR family regulator